MTLNYFFRCKGTHQITKIGSLTVEEHWDPRTEGLDPLVVTRKIPTIHILLSKTELNLESGTPQPPDFNVESLWRGENSAGRKKSGKRNPKGRKNADELGMTNIKADYKGKNDNKKGKEKANNKNFGKDMQQKDLKSVNINQVKDISTSKSENNVVNKEELSSK